MKTLKIKDEDVYSSNTYLVRLVEPGELLSSKQTGYGAVNDEGPVVEIFDQKYTMYVNNAGKNLGFLINKFDADEFQDLAANPVNGRINLQEGKVTWRMTEKNANKLSEIINDWKATIEISAAPGPGL